MESIKLTKFFTELTFCQDFLRNELFIEFRKPCCQCRAFFKSLVNAGLGYAFYSIKSQLRKQ